jgi:hypothetical protein
MIKDQHGKSISVEDCKGEGGQRGKLMSVLYFLTRDNVKP